MPGGVLVHCNNVTKKLLSVLTRNAFSSCGWWWGTLISTRTKPHSQRFGFWPILIWIYPIVYNGLSVSLPYEKCVIILFLAKPNISSELLNFTSSPKWKFCRESHNWSPYLWLNLNNGCVNHGMKLDAQKQTKTTERTQTDFDTFNIKMISIQPMSIQMGMFKILAPIKGRTVFEPPWLGPGPGCSQIHVAKTVVLPHHAKPRRCGAHRPCMPACQWGSPEQKLFQSQCPPVLHIFEKPPKEIFNLLTFEEIFFCLIWGRKPILIAILGVR